MTGTDVPNGGSQRSPPRDVFERVTDAVFALDDEFRFTFLDEQAESLLQCERADVTGEHIWEEFPAMADSMFQWEYERALETQASLTFEAYYPPLESWFESRVFPSESGISVLARDVTDPDNRKHELEEREQALRRAYEVIADSERPFSEQIDSILEVVRNAISTDYATLSRVNEGAGEYHFEHVAVPNGVDLEPGHTTPLESLPNCSHVVETAETLVLQDVEAEAPELADPEWGISCYLGSPVVVNGEVYGTFCFYGMEAQTEEFSDWEVTFVDLLSSWVSKELTRQAYEEELEESNERLEQFAHAASHDLQEPLRMVSSYLTLIEDRYGDTLDEDGQEFLEFAVDGADRMRGMLQSLLAYSRIETQGDPFEPVDLDSVFAEVRTDLELRIEKNDAEITVADLPRVEGDSSQLRQVFQNLLDNAIEYSGDELPRVHVSARRNGDRWEISVRDEGVGIDPDDTDRVFELFQSLHTPGDHAGTGIGLTLCERIVERHGGEIWVESDPGQGTTFSFTLPAVGECDS